MMKYVPLIREKLHMSGHINPLQNIKLIDRGYLTLPSVQKYYESNIKHFKNRNMSLMFHYWFIFDECDTEKVTVITAEQLMTNCDLKKYDSQAFIDYLRKFILSPNEPKYSPLLALKFYVDYEMWLPLGFNAKYYTSTYADLSNMSEFQAIEHWIDYGKSEGRSGVPPIEHHQ